MSLFGGADLATAAGILVEGADFGGGGGGRCLGGDDGSTKGSEVERRRE